jgi:RimJ/RimL family protein N-acetyltransferase
MLELIAILRDGTPARPMASPVEHARDVLTATVQMYDASGFEMPWVAYLATEDGACVGTCAFKRAPCDGRVEIAYYTFPAHEGKGIATRMARALIDIAARANGDLVVAAQTLPAESASTAILRKLGFANVGTVEHPEDGPVWEWRRPAVL